MSETRQRHIDAAVRAYANRTGAENVTPLDKLLSLSEVRALTGKSRSTIYREMAAGTFPAARKIGASRIAFLSSDINRWLAKLPPISLKAA